MSKVKERVRRILGALDKWHWSKTLALMLVTPFLVGSLAGLVPFELLGVRGLGQLLVIVIFPSPGLFVLWRALKSRDIFFALILPYGAIAAFSGWLAMLIVASSLYGFYPLDL